MGPEGREIYSDSMGIAFSIPPEAVSEDKSLWLSWWSCFTGPFQSPEEYEIVSPPYHFSRSGKLTKDAETVIYHSLKLRTDEECQRMTFLLAPSTPSYNDSQPQYDFQVLEGGVFEKNGNFGSIKRQHFSDVPTDNCVLAIGVKGTKPPGYPIP